MSFTATPADGSATPIPMSSVVPDGTNTPIALEGGPSLSSGGNTLAPASVYLKDGNNVTFVAEADSAATTDTGTFSFMAFIKRLLQKIPSNLINVGTPTETAVSVGTGNTAVIAANSSRKYLLLINDSSAIIYVSFSGTAALNTGIRLNPNGGSVLFDKYVPTAIVKAVATAAASNLLVSEG